MKCECCTRTRQLCNRHIGFGWGVCVWIWWHSNQHNDCVKLMIGRLEWGAGVGGGLADWSRWLPICLCTLASFAFNFIEIISENYWAPPMRRLVVFWQSCKWALAHFIIMTISSENKLVAPSMIPPPPQLYAQRSEYNNHNCLWLNYIRKYCVHFQFDYYYYIFAIVFIPLTTIWTN